MNFYKFFISDYLSHTVHLTDEEDLCYRRLLDLYYDTEKPIPKNIPWVSRRLRVGFEVAERVLQEFFEDTPEGYKNARADHEIAEYYAYLAKQKANGKKGGRPKKQASKTHGKPTANPPKSDGEPRQNPKKANKNLESNINYPSDNLIIPEEKTAAEVKALTVIPRKPVRKNFDPDNLLATVPDLPQQVANDFLRVRAAKNAPITATGMAAIEREAEKAGVTTAQAIAIATARNWQGFKADWLNDTERKTFAERKQEFLDQKAQKFYGPLFDMTEEERKAWGFQ